MLSLFEKKTGMTRFLTVKAVITKIGESATKVVPLALISTSLLSILIALAITPSHEA